jgi:hypothetical protein
VLAAAVDQQSQAMRLGKNPASCRMALASHLTELADVSRKLGAYDEAARLFERQVADEHLVRALVLQDTQNPVNGRSFPLVVSRQSGQLAAIQQPIDHGAARGSRLDGRSLLRQDRHRVAARLAVVVAVDQAAKRVLES